MNAANLAATELRNAIENSHDPHTIAYKTQQLAQSMGVFLPYGSPPEYATLLLLAVVLQILTTEKPPT